MKLANRFAFWVIAAAAVVGVATLGPALMRVPYDESDSVAVTFDVRLGDGLEWAGGCDILYVIAGTAYPVRLQPLKNGDRRQNIWVVTKVVKKPTKVSLSATPMWTGIPVRVQLRAPGVTARPVKAIGPRTATISTLID
jgi:hypothetical protein